MSEQKRLDRPFNQVQGKPELREKIAREVRESTDPDGWHKWRYLPKELKDYYRGIADQILALIHKLTFELGEVARQATNKVVEEAKKQERGKTWECEEVFILKPECINFIDKGKLDPDCKAHKMCEHGVHYPYRYCPMSCYQFTRHALKGEK